MQTTSVTTSSGTVATSNVPGEEPQTSRLSPRSERLLDRYEPAADYFAHSATAAEIARARGVGRLTYEAA